MPLDAPAMPTVLAAETLPVSLAETARADMERVFATGERAGKHRPSPTQWAAIVDYLEHAEMAADGNLKLAVYTPHPGLQPHRTLLLPWRAAPDRAA